jgi:DNA-binding response OmpR family regulator
MSVWQALLNNPNQIFSRETLNAARPKDAYFNPSRNHNSIESVIKRLRHKIVEKTGYTTLIRTKQGRGYQLNRYWYDAELEKREADL